jgi:hypothetical protein
MEAENSSEMLVMTQDNIQRYKGFILHNAFRTCFCTLYIHLRITCTTHFTNNTFVWCPYAVSNSTKREAHKSWIFQIYYHINFCGLVWEFTGANSTSDVRMTMLSLWDLRSSGVLCSVIPQRSADLLNIAAEAWNHGCYLYVSKGKSVNVGWHITRYPDHVSWKATSWLQKCYEGEFNLHKRN